MFEPVLLRQCVGIKNSLSQFLLYLDIGSEQCGKIQWQQFPLEGSRSVWPPYSMLTIRWMRATLYIDSAQAG